MKSVQLFDVLPDSGIFTAINNIKAFPWVDFVTPAQMDTTYKQLYCGKPVSKTVLRFLGDNSTLTDDNIKALANILYNLYYEKWSLAFTLFMNRETAFGSGYMETIKETITHDNSGTNTGTTTDKGSETGKISAYNSTEFQDKDFKETGNTNTQDLANTDKGEQVRDYVRTGYGDYYVDNYKKIIEALQSELLYDIIYTDANNVLALHIYD